MRSSRQIWDLFSKRFKPFQSRPFCTNSKTSKPTNNETNISKEEVNAGESSSITRQDAYKQLENLDFMTAAKILFTTPPKKKKFGIDFHLVQLFFACMPSLAVYLVAQYARSEMRRMEAELEVKKKAEEEAKPKELELKALEEEVTSDPQLLEVKVRLDKLEETVKEIVVESKKKSSDSTENSEVDGGIRKQPTIVKSNSSATDARNCYEGSSGKQTCEGRTSSAALIDTSRHDEKSCQNERPSPDVKK